MKALKARLAKLEKKYQTKEQQVFIIVSFTCESEPIGYRYEDVDYFCDDAMDRIKTSAAFSKSAGINICFALYEDGVV